MAMKQHRNSQRNSGEQAPEMARNFPRGKFHSHPNALFDLFTLNLAKDFDRITVPETDFKCLVSLGTKEALASTATSDRRRAKIRSPGEFAIDHMRMYL
jgi:hypothetical protein